MGIFEWLLRGALVATLVGCGAPTSDTAASGTDYVCVPLASYFDCACVHRDHLEVAPSLLRDGARKAYREHSIFEALQGEDEHGAVVRLASVHTKGETREVVWSGPQASDQFSGAEARFATMLSSRKLESPNLLMLGEAGPNTLEHRGSDSRSMNVIASCPAQPQALVFVESGGASPRPLEVSSPPDGPLPFCMCGEREELAWGPDGTVVEVRCIPDGSALPSLVAALDPSGFPVRIDEAIHEDVVVERPTGRCEDPLEAVTLRPSWRTTRYRWNERNELAGVRVEYDGVCYGAVLEVEPEPGVRWRAGRCFDGRDVGLWYEADAGAEHVIATDHGDGRGLAVVLPPIVPQTIEHVSP